MSGRQQQQQQQHQQHFSGDPIQGGSYVVMSSWGDPVTATLLHTRTHGVNRRTQYFFHYEGRDKRMDEWLYSDAVLDAAAVGGGGEVAATAATAATAAASQQSKRPSRGSRALNYAEDEGGGGGVVKEAAVAKAAPPAPQRKEETNVKYIDEIQYGSRHLIRTWYYSPYPAACQRKAKLFVCERCMAYYLTDDQFDVHVQECCSAEALENLPGRRIYSRPTFQVREVRGAADKIFCQCLCLFAKLFLEGKYLFFLLDNYRFYVIYQLSSSSSSSASVAGFFSKDMLSPTNNLACIIVFPPFQRLGYGKLLISLSYELTRLTEHRLASPEKPLTDLGGIMYRSYWAWKVCTALMALFALRPNVVVMVRDLATLCNMTAEDTLHTLTHFRLVPEVVCQRLFSVRLPDLRRVAARLARPPALVVDPDFIELDHDDEAAAAAAAAAAAGDEEGPPPSDDEGTIVGGGESTASAAAAA